MGRGGAIYLSYTAIALLSHTSSVLAATDDPLLYPNVCAFCRLWPINIDEAPAPSPEDGPPFSAHAIRNKAVLPYEIIGVVGAYIASVFILGTLLLTVGRTLRKRAQQMAAKPTELVKPMRKQFDPSPISPHSARSMWYSPRKLKSKKSAASSIRSGSSNIASPAMDSVVSFDQNVVEADRMRRQEEMEKLYAAVMAHDERKSPPGSLTLEVADGQQPPAYQQRRQQPPQIITDAPALRHLKVAGQQLSPRSPGTPLSPVRAIYPPGAPMPTYMPNSPTSLVRAEYPTTPLSPNYPPQQAEEQHTHSRSRTSSIPSIRSGTSTTGASGKKLRRSLRHLKISSPLQTDDNSDGARTPLSPRFYTDPGVPPEPPTARTVDTTRTVDSAYLPTTPGTVRSQRSYRFDDERGEFESEDDDEEVLDEVRDLPQTHPNRMSAYAYGNQAQALTNAASPRPNSTVTTRQNKESAVTSTNRALPFRELNLQRAAFPLSPGAWNPHVPLSAGPGRTQFVDVRRDRLGAPRTGMATPYSPYMPFTPLTPVTPRLTSRAERRQRKREDRSTRGVITEEDAVVSDKELWSSGY